MNMNQVRARARIMEIEPGKMDRKALVRAIQEKEGNSPCFKTGSLSCDQHDCCWRDDCKPGNATATM